MVEITADVAQLFADIENGSFLLEEETFESANPDTKGLDLKPDENVGSNPTPRQAPENMNHNGHLPGDPEPNEPEENDKRWDDDIKKFIAEKLDKPNTLRAMKRDVTQLQQYLYTHMEMRPLEEISPEELNRYLCLFFTSLVKKNGDLYEPSSLTAKLHSIDRYLDRCEYGASIRSDETFKLARKSLLAKKVQSKEDGKGDRPHKALGLKPGDEDKLKRAGVLGDCTPFGLQFSIWYMITMVMGRRGRDEHYDLTWGDFQIKTDSDGKEYMELKEKVTKTRDGTDDKNVRKAKSKYFCICQDDPSSCLIEWVKKFASLRPENTKEHGSPFYLTPIPLNRLNSSSQEWYYESHMGINSIGKFLPNACKLAEIEHRSNHGARRTAIKRMRKQGVPDSKIAKITGHKSESTLNVYDDDLSDDEHEEIQSVIVGGTRAKPCAALSVAPKSPIRGQSGIQAKSDYTLPVQNIPVQPTSSVRQLQANPGSIAQSIPALPTSNLSGFLHGTVMSNCTINFNITMHSHDSHVSHSQSNTNVLSVDSS